MSIPLQIRIQAAAAKLLYALPQPVRRLIAGRPVRRDGPHCGCWPSQHQLETLVRCGEADSFVETMRVDACLV